MRVARSLAEFAALRAELPAPHQADLGYVPTMGALHDGHRSLIAIARERAAAVAVSIFVNPLQFGPNEDYARYPRPLEDDLAGCERAGVDLVLAPPVAELYPAGRQVTVSAGNLGAVLEGASRPGHFDGVLTVVLKFLHLVRPRFAVFGQKDAQQLACVRRMVLDLNLDVEILAGPTVRDFDGLALSSRNAFLTPTERAVALALPAALESAAGQSTPTAARAAADAVIERAAQDPMFALDYAALVDPVSFAAIGNEHAGAALFAIAARVGRTRLIDNRLLAFAPEPAELG